MQDMKAQAEKLRSDAAECALIRDLATDASKRDLFSRLADHMLVLAQEVERALKREIAGDQGNSAQSNPAELDQRQLALRQSAAPTGPEVDVP